MNKVLIIEDDKSMLRGLADNFEVEGYQVLTASTGDKGLDLALNSSPDLIVLDVMLPDMNGYEICRFIRDEKIETAIIMLTAKDQESDVVLGLKLGADDYMTKPFSIRELLARAEALLRRKNAKADVVYAFGDFTLDIPSHTLAKNGMDIELSPKEFELIRYFTENAGRALSRENIMNSVWGYGSSVTPRSIDRFVNSLRNKIEPDPKKPAFITTIREFGYKFVENP